MNIDGWLDDYVQRLRSHRIAQDLVGCSASEMDDIETEFKVCLPRLYRSWMMRFGKNAGKLASVSEFSFYWPEIVEVNREVRRLKEPLEFIPSEPYFIVLGRFGVFQYVLDSRGKEDAIVYQLDVDDVVPPEAVYNSLADVLEALLQDHLPLPPPAR